MKGVTSVYIPPDLREKVDKISEITHKPMSIIIREALMDYTEKFMQKQALKKYVEENFGENVDKKEVLKKLILDILNEEKEE